jgi:phosphoserine aminotransferase
LNQSLEADCLYIGFSDNKYKYVKETLIMERIYNFSAGPAMLPESVLKKAQEEMMNYRDSGMSVMEMSHRSKHYEEIIKGAERVLRESS